MDAIRVSVTQASVRSATCLVSNSRSRYKALSEPGFEANNVYNVLYNKVQR